MRNAWQGLALGLALHGGLLLYWWGRTPIAPMPLPARILPDRPTHRSDLGADLLQPIVLESSEDGTDLRLLPQFRARLRLNQSSAEALEAIPGLSARAARNLVEYRRTHGPFQDLQELLEVQGIGPATLAKLQDFVVLDGVQAAGAKD